MGKEYRTYIAMEKIHLGLNDKENSEQLVIEEGDVVEYNGRIAKIDGVEYALPRLKSAISSRWLVDQATLLQGNVESYRPISAKIEMSGATPEQERIVAATTISEEERNVGTIEAVRARGRYENPNNYPVEAQEGVVVGGTSFQTRAYGEGASEGMGVQATDVSAMTSTSTISSEESTAARKARELQEAENARLERKIRALQEKLANQAPVQEPRQVREGIEFEMEGISQRTAGTTAQDEESLSSIWDGGDGAVTVGSVHDEPEINAEDVVQDKEARLALARQMMPSFDWDFSVHWRTKLKLLEDSNNPTLVIAAYAVESDAMKKHIAKSFPQYQLGA